ncbi:LppU/SCO3897 family protein [Streptomyces silvisoli]|uniref:Septum formation-related domain-containing protein n=1 Tax=Streptomyces silvisoli TaxID=3034235 RepID=A0ABT5ZE50_9ACTN|nr:hypothetical protein [Streptomyces silvisoli]MDF3288103.1 hypothetical protein [Streptomyces silvisoli]
MTERPNGTTEVIVRLTPQEAASGVTKVVALPGETLTLGIPPCQDGSLVRITHGRRELLLRIRVTVGDYPSAVRPKRSGAAALLALGTVGVIMLIGVASCDSGSPAGATNPVAAASSSYDDSGGATDTPTPGPTDTSTPTASPYRTGTCLNGTLPDSTTAQEVNDVSEVDCSSSDAHYRVIQTFYETTDLSRCDSNPGTQYAFSDKETWGGSVIDEYVYCLVGLGSYAR